MGSLILRVFHAISIWEGKQNQSESKVHGEKQIMWCWKERNRYLELRECPLTISNLWPTTKDHIESREPKPLVEPKTPRILTRISCLLQPRPMLSIWIPTEISIHRQLVVAFSDKILLVLKAGAFWLWVDMIWENLAKWFHHIHLLTNWLQFKVQNYIQVFISSFLC